jgi:AAT family amino acid transporter/GABA permease
MNSGIFVCSRVLYRLAGNRDAPYALSVTTRQGVPRRAVLASAFVAYVAVAVSVFSPTGVFVFLVNASGAVMLFVYLLVAAAQLRLRRRASKAEQDAMPLKMWLFPWLTIATIVAIVAILIAMGADAALAPQLWSTVAFTVVLIAAFALSQWVLRRRGVEPTATRS